MSSSDRERDDSSEARSCSVEVTPEMIEAGFRVLEKSGIADVYLEADKVLVAEIFETMFASMPRRGAGQS